MPAAIVSYFENLWVMNTPVGRLENDFTRCGWQEGTKGGVFSCESYFYDRNRLRGHGCAPGRP
jgi:hypothetical protein